MSGKFAWVSEVERGVWIAERLDGHHSYGGLEGRDALAATVPSGFDAIVRVLHPFSRDRLEGTTWAEIGEMRGRGDYSLDPKPVEEAGVTWRDAAAVHGTEFRPDITSYEVLGIGRDEHRDVESGDGWRYHSPDEGTIPVATLDRVAAVLAKYTQTPDRGVAAVWEGWAGLVSAQGVGFFVMAAPLTRVPGFLQRFVIRLKQKRVEFQLHRQKFGLRSALRALLLKGVRQPVGSGILPKEAAAGPRLVLPDRAYICFEAGISDFAGESGAGSAWPARAPWVDEPSSWWIQSPNVIWPDGHEWVLISEIDFDSTLIACSRECADALLGPDGTGAAGLEVVEITRDTQLWR